MKNKERQASLDKQKYIESEKECLDMRGLMLWCYSCNIKSECTGMDYSDIQKQTICAKAYNRMKRKAR